MGRGRAEHTVGLSAAVLDTSGILKSVTANTIRTMIWAVGRTRRTGEVAFGGTAVSVLGMSASTAATHGGGGAYRTAFRALVAETILLVEPIIAGRAYVGVGFIALQAAGQAGDALAEEHELRAEALHAEAL
jgi:hypothetical protein